MDYSFVRKLAKEAPKADADKIYQILTEKGIEVFAKSEEGYKHVAAEDFIDFNDLYVSAADLEYAKMLVAEIGKKDVLCNEMEIDASMEKSEVEKAEEEFYRKHKQNQLFAGIIIIGVIIFMLFQMVKM